MRLLVVILFLASCAAPPATSASDPRHAAQHRLLVIEEAPGGWHVKQRTVVDAPLPRRRGPEPTGDIRVVFFDAGGGVLFSETLRDPRWVSGDHALVRSPTPAAFTLRVPVLLRTSQNPCRWRCGSSGTCTPVRWCLS